MLIPHKSTEVRGERGTVLLLYPVGFMILLLFAAIAVDMSNGYLQQRELADLADGAANDALTFGLDRDALRAGNGYELDAGKAQTAALASIAASNDGNVRVVSVTAARNAAGNWEYEVVLETDVQYIFGPVGGVAGNTVRATGRAEVLTQAP